MKLASCTYYSLRMLAYVATQGRHRPTIAQAAESLGISESHLKKVVILLGQHGYLANLRGRNGGLCLAKAARDIVIGSVVRVIEQATTFGNQASVSDQSASGVRQQGRIHEILNRATEAFYGQLDEFNIADISSANETLGCVESNLAMIFAHVGFEAVS